MTFNTVMQKRHEYLENANFQTCNFHGSVPWENWRRLQSRLETVDIPFLISSSSNILCKYCKNADIDMGSVQNFPALKAKNAIKSFNGLTECILSYTFQHEISVQPKEAAKCKIPFFCFLDNIQLLKKKNPRNFLI